MKRLTILAILAVTTAALAASNEVAVKADTDTVARYDVYELSLEGSQPFANPWEDPDIAAVFTAPSGKQYKVGGFLYAIGGETDPRKVAQLSDDELKTWKLRFAPMEVGEWKWDLAFSDTTNEKLPAYKTTGAFTATDDPARKGFLRVHPIDNHRFMTEADGEVFHPRGGTYSAISYGGDLEDMQWFTDHSWQPTGIDEYFTAIKSAGHNMVNWYDKQYCFEFIHQNKAKTDFNIDGSGKNRYDLTESAFYDRYIQTIHRHDLKFMMLLSTNPAIYIGDWANVPADPAITKALLNYHKYLINRYGAYTDIWRLFSALRNEAPQAYIDTVIPFIRAHDPYQHPIAVNDFPAGYDKLDVVVAPNYVPSGTLIGEQIANLTRATLAKATPNAATGLKPPMLSGLWIPYPLSTAEFTTAYPRIMLWACFHNHGAFMSHDVQGEHDWETRRVDKVFTDHAAGFDPAAVPASTTVSPADQLAAYAMSSPKDLALYIVATKTQNATFRDATVELDVPADGMRGQWMNTDTGERLGQPLTLKAGKQKLAIPPFRSDIGLRLRGGLAPSTLEFDKSAYVVKMDAPAAVLTVVRTGDATKAASVNYATRDSIGLADRDYKATSGKLEWAAGDATPKTITVPLIPKTRLSHDLDLLVDLSEPSEGADLGTSRTALVALLNTVVNTVENIEPNYIVRRDAGKIDITLKRVGNGVGELIMPYSTSPKTALRSKDFMDIAMNDKNFFRWEDGEMGEKTITIPILDNPEAETDLQFEFHIGGNIFAQGDHPVYIRRPGQEQFHTGSTPPDIAHAMIVIQHPTNSGGLLRIKGSEGYTRDSGMHYQFYTPLYTVSADKEYAEITVSRLYGSKGEISTKYRTNPGTAVAGRHYTSVQGTLTWADGDTADKVIRIPVFNVPGETGTVGTVVTFDPPLPQSQAHWGIAPHGGYGYAPLARASIHIVYPEEK